MVNEYLHTCLLQSYRKHRLTELPYKLNQLKVTLKQHQRHAGSLGGWVT